MRHMIVEEGDEESDAGHSASCARDIAPGLATTAAESAESKQTEAAALIDRLAREEQLGEELLSERAQMVELDRQRNANREAIAALRRVERAEGDAEFASTHKYWMLQGDVFVRRRHGGAHALLEEDVRRLDSEIKALHQSVKKRSSHLCELDPSIFKGSNVHKSFVELHGVSAGELEGLLK